MVGLDERFEGACGGTGGAEPLSIDGGLSITSVLVSLSHVTAGGVAVPEALLSEFACSKLDR